MKRWLYAGVAFAALVWAIYNAVRIWFGLSLAPGLANINLLWTTQAGQYMLVGVVVFLVFGILWIQSRKEDQRGKH